jgi:SNF2 family DNA or RNA helicase
MEENIINIGKSKLTKFQLDILEECLIKSSGGLSLTMGSGKTILSIVLSLILTELNNKPILVVVSKTLIETWIFEIKKFFGDKLKYIVLHAEYIKKIREFTLNDDIRLVITTPDFITKYYKEEFISFKFIKQTIVNEGIFGQHFVNNYLIPSKPYSNINIGGSILYSTEWGCLLVDEVQNYTKISSLRCQGIGSLCALNRWALSGTMFNEPITERILGYYIIINDKTFPRTLPAAEAYIRTPMFKGFSSSLVCRKSNPTFIKPKINNVIISHDLSYEEKRLYMSMKNIMLIIKKKVEEFKRVGDTINTRKFGTYLLSIICYLRQCLVCSILPISNVAIDMTNFSNKSELSKFLMKEIENLNIKEWLNDKNSVKSSRMKEALKIIDKHKNENIVIFTCFRTCLDIFTEFLPEDRKVMTIKSTMSSKKRISVLEEFNKEELGKILFLTYDIGSEGLNLQVANTVLLLDFYWNDGKTNQSIARVLRYGQLSNEVNIYFFTSNTGIEKALFEKQDLKLQLISELETGNPKTKVSKMKVNQIINIIETEDNIRALEKINNRKR